MITVNIVNIIILLLGMFIIWVMLPEDYKEELGSLIGWTIEAVWIIIWIIVFPVLGHGVHISISFY